MSEPRDNKLYNIHSKLKLNYGSFYEELPEQKMAVRYLTGNEKVLEIGGNIGRNSLIIASILNSNNNDMGDMIYLSQHVFTEASSSAGVENITFNNNVVIGVDNECNKVTIAYELNQMAKMAINIVDLNGKSVSNKNAMNGQIGTNHFDVSTNDFKSGVYIVNFFIDNKPFSKKIIVK